MDRRTCPLFLVFVLSYFMTPSDPSCPCRPFKLPKRFHSLHWKIKYLILTISKVVNVASNSKYLEAPSPTITPEWVNSISRLRAILGRQLFLPWLIRALLLKMFVTVSSLLHIRCYAGSSNRLARAVLLHSPVDNLAATRLPGKLWRYSSII